MDSFDYGVTSPLTTLRERPCSYEYSFMSFVDDTFSFFRRQPRGKRVDSGASNFYFRASGHSQMYPCSCVGSDRCHESLAPVASLGPPITATPSLAW